MRISALRHLKERLSSAARDRNGSAAVEFSLVVVPFLAIMMSTFEVGWFYFANSQTDAATIEASRFIRTGQAQEGGFDKDEFFEAVCPHLEIFGDCSSTLTVQVDTFSSFATLAADTSPVICRDDDTDKIEELTYDPGSDNSIVRVRICLLYKTLNPTIGVNVSNVEGGKRRLYGTYIFRNEPYSKNNRT